jgi:hypothetical protein
VETAARAGLAGAGGPGGTITVNFGVDYDRTRVTTNVAGGDAGAGGQGGLGGWGGLGGYGAWGGLEASAPWDYGADGSPGETGSAGAAGAPGSTGAVGDVKLLGTPTGATRVVFGDSYMSGEGAKPLSFWPANGLGKLDCHNAPGSWANWVAAGGNSPTNTPLFEDNSCTGDTLSDISAQVAIAA